MVIKYLPVGIKKVAWILAGSLCPYYKPMEEYKWRKINKKHSRIVDLVRKKFERKGYICYKECVLPANTKGRIDLLCFNYKLHEVNVVEVKSYTLEKLHFADILQTILYKSILKDLVESVGVLRICCLGNVLVRLEKQLKFKANVAYVSNHNTIVVRIDDLVDSMRVLAQYVGEDKEFIKTLKKYFIVGSWCKFCVNKECPYSVGVS